MNIRVRDVTEQRGERTLSLSPEATVEELLASAKEALELPENRDYRGRNEREAKLLNDSEILGDVLRDEDTVGLAESVEAG